MEYLYYNSTGLPVQHQFQKVSDSLSWGHLSKREVIVPLKAWKLKDKLPHEYPSETGPTGAYLSLDKATDPCWFNKDITWDSFTPIQLGLDQPPWFTNEEFHAIREIEHAAGFSITPECRTHWTADLDDADRCCTALRGVSPYPMTMPILAICPRFEFEKVHSHLHSAERSMARIKRFMLSSVAFIWYSISVRSDWQSALEPDIIEAIIRLTSGLKEKRGVLIDLERDWPVIDIALWVRNDVPVVFAWTPAIDSNPRFQRLSPRFQDAVWKMWDEAGVQ
ncbi:hypothetical protein Hypma_002984, partial [Hypsizygus marmoreus]